MRVRLPIGLHLLIKNGGAIFVHVAERKDGLLRHDIVTVTRITERGRCASLEIQCVQRKNISRCGRSGGANGIGEFVSI
jgi:hypothetical protein